MRFWKVNVGHFLGADADTHQSPTPEISRQYVRLERLTLVPSVGDLPVVNEDRWRKPKLE